MLRLIILACTAAALVSVTAQGVTLRWANRGDPQTTDPHSQNEGLTNNINQLVYEFLVGRDKKLELGPKGVDATARESLSEQIRRYSWRRA